jgi:hypothetical protein
MWLGASTDNKKQHWNIAVANMWIILVNSSLPTPTFGSRWSWLAVSTQWQLVTATLSEGDDVLWHFVSDSHKFAAALIVVSLPFKLLLWRFLCNLNSHGYIVCQLSSWGCVTVYYAKTLCSKVEPLTTLKGML